MLRSPGLRLFIVGFLIFLMNIPLFFVSDVINSRADYNRSALSEVGREWGGQQLISGPVLVIPVEETISERLRSEVIDEETGIQMRDEDGKLLYRVEDVEKVVRRDPVYLYPDRFDVTLGTATQERRRGIFAVPVFTADSTVLFDFPTTEVAKALRGGERALWHKAELEIRVSSNRALRGEAILRAGDQILQMEPLEARDDRHGGLRAPTGDPRQHGQYQLQLGFNGAQSLALAPVGRTSRVEITSDWPDPGFDGAFLPDGYEISDQGFTATWTIPHLARPLPQVARESQDSTARGSTAFGVDFYQPNDFYQKSFRAARYGLMFIGLTFLTIFLIEGRSGRPTHPVQYLLVGMAQSVFFLLMLALAEQLGFAAAYGIAGSATVLLLTGFAGMALKLGRRTLVLGAMLTALYGVLYLVLRSADYALLAGSTIAFLAIAGTMYATRNENWYGESRDKRKTGWFRRAPPPAQAQTRSPAQEPPASPPPVGQS